MSQEHELLLRGAEVCGQMLAGGLIGAIGFIAGVTLTVTHFNMCSDLVAKVRGQCHKVKVDE